MLFVMEALHIDAMQEGAGGKELTFDNLIES